MSQPEYLFVYGTLRPEIGAGPARYLKEWAGCIGPGRARGQLYNIGDYPGMLPASAESEWVWGEVYLIEKPAMLYRLLDAYEGCDDSFPAPHEYYRGCVEVELAGGSRLMAGCYWYAWPVVGLERIISGDYVGWRQQK